MDIIQTLAQEASSLSENDLSWILPKIHDKYHTIIANFATAAKQNDALSKAALAKASFCVAALAKFIIIGRYLS